MTSVHGGSVSECRSGSKHRTDDGPGPRSKRAKYTPIACNECKKRKMKCIPDESSGRCHRCQSTGAECVFAPNQPAVKPPPSADDRFGAINAKLASLQKRMNLLEREVRSSRDADGNSADSPDESRRSGVHRQPGFVGPTRPSYSFDVARESMQDMGIVVEASAFSAAASPAPSPSPPAALAKAASSDPLWILGKAEVLRLVDVYADEIHPLYPFVNVPEIVNLVQLHFDSGSDGGLAENKLAQSGCILKVVVAIAKVIESYGRNDVSRRLVDSVETEIFGTSISSDAVLEEMVATALLSLYHFHTDQELLAWRTIGLASRMTLEMGLHRKQSLMAHWPDPEQRVWALRLFWCIYVLDRRWSFGRSLPFALQDADIEPELPEPDHEVEFLQCCLRYARICSQIWHAVPVFGPPSRGVPDETVSYLEYQVQKWSASIPLHLRYVEAQQATSQQSADRVSQRLRALLYLRGNHARLLLNRHHVLSAANVRADIPGAQRVVDIAKDSIQVLVDLHESSDIYMRQQAAFNYYLVSSLAAIFLAVCHYPSIFGTQCRHGFYSAVELIRGFSMQSPVSKRLWNSVKGLLPSAKKLGLDTNSSGHIQRPVRGQEYAKLDLPQTAAGEGSSNGADRGDVRMPTPRTSSGQELGTDLNLGWPADQGFTETSPAFSGSLPDMGQMTNDLTSFYEAFGQMDDTALYGTHTDLNGGFPDTGDGEVSHWFQDLMSW